MTQQSCSRAAYASRAALGHLDAIRVLLRSGIGAREIAWFLDIPVGRVRSLMYANGLEGSEHARKFARDGEANGKIPEAYRVGAR